MHARMLSVVVFLPELRTVARRVLLLDIDGLYSCSRQLCTAAAMRNSSSSRRGGRAATKNPLQWCMVPMYLANRYLGTI